DDLMSLESEEIKLSRRNDAVLRSWRWKNTVAVIGEVICSEESLESVPSFIEEYDGELVEDNKNTFLKKRKKIQVQQVNVNRTEIHFEKRNDHSGLGFRCDTQQIVWEPDKKDQNSYAYMRINKANL
ncbi:hypothetical protein CEXT_461281, partial [Caerostris extrusa]